MSGKGRATRRSRVARELALVLAFCLLTAALTWPYVTRLHDAVVDPGDPYLITWIMWWDYHQTFRDPLQLFHSNTFYPLRYTLAFSEHCYGLALLFFPLFALSFRPLTVHAVAIFCGFALSGYGAFRLARTLSGSEGAAWIAGIAFAFVPYRFYLMSQAMYLFAAWIPLVFEALVLFARVRSRGRAAWLGVSFFMLGLTTISWFTLALVPLGLCGAVLLTRYNLWRDGAFWRRGAASLCVASLALLPFMLPYYLVSKLYGFKRSVEEVKAGSARLSDWLAAESRNKLWGALGASWRDGARFPLFPGLLTPLCALAAVTPASLFKGRARPTHDGRPARPLRLDALIVGAIAIAIPAVWFDRTDYFGGLFRYVTSERALALLAATGAARVCLAYPSFLRRSSTNFVETLRSERRGDAFWIGLILVLVGFLYSLGWNTFFYRICYDLLPIFRSMRVPARGALFAHLGLALLAGSGVRRLAEVINARRPRVSILAVYVVACAVLLAELNAAPLGLMRGAADPDAVTHRLRETDMRGGVVILPAGPDFNHAYMLRAADHARPLVVGTSGFNSPQEDQIERLTTNGIIPLNLLDLLEEIPVSYIVVKNDLVAPKQRTNYSAFLARAVDAGRLRFVKRFDGLDDLYAVVKTEPAVRAEAPPPAELKLRDWASMLDEDSLNLLGQYADWSRALYRLHLVARGRMPRYSEFMRDARALGRGVIPGTEEAQRDFDARLAALARDWEQSEAFRELFGETDDARYAERLYRNAGIEADPSERAALAAQTQTRAAALLKVAADPRLEQRGRQRAVLLLHYFAFLRRNPDDPPDHDLTGFDFWLSKLEETNDPDKIALAFRDSIEYKATKNK